MIECTNCLFTEKNYPQIYLDENGVCDICKVNIDLIQNNQKNKTEQNRLLNLEKIKSSKKGKYDCLIGISGGADSTYLVHLAKEWGLTPLLLHIDGGWNSAIAVENINNLLKTSGFDYVTVVMDWNEIRDIQKAFIQANVLDIDLPFDNAMLAYNMSIAKKNNIKYVLNGYSLDTEGIMPEGFTHYKMDKKNILDVYKKMTGKKVRKIRFIGTFGYLYYKKIKKIEFLYPLNWIEYKKEEIKEIIKREYNWSDYGAKHYDNVFTRFYQGYILPKKFNIDKRISHISMLICSNQIDKVRAKEILEDTPLYSPEAELKDKQFFIKKIGLTEEEFENYMSSIPVSHRIYKSDLDIYDRYKTIYQWFKKVFGFKVFEN
jgi:N-acetyl sugar amidotransferase